MTNDIYDIHPNYRTYRKLVNDHMMGNLETDNTTKPPTASSTNDNNDDDKVEDIEEQLRQLDLEFKAENLLLQNHVSNAAKSNAVSDEALLIAKLTVKFEALENCKKNVKVCSIHWVVTWHRSGDQELYQNCKTALDQVSVEMISIENKCASRLLYDEYVDDVADWAESDLPRTFIDTADIDNSLSEGDQSADENSDLDRLLKTMDDDEVAELTDRMCRGLTLSRANVPQ